MFHSLSLLEMFLSKFSPEICMSQLFSFLIPDYLLQQPHRSRCYKVTSLRQDAQEFYKGRKITHKQTFIFNRHLFLTDIKRHNDNSWPLIKLTWVRRQVPHVVIGQVQRSMDQGPGLETAGRPPITPHRPVASVTLAPCLLRGRGRVRADFFHDQVSCFTRHSLPCLVRHKCKRSCLDFVVKCFGFFFFF